MKPHGQSSTQNRGSPRFFFGPTDSLAGARGIPSRPSTGLIPSRGVAQRRSASTCAMKQSRGICTKKKTESVPHPSRVAPRRARVASRSIHREEKIEKNVDQKVTSCVTNATAQFASLCEQSMEHVRARMRELQRAMREDMRLQMRAFVLEKDETNLSSSNGSALITSDEHSPVHFGRDSRSSHLMIARRMYLIEASIAEFDERCKDVERFLQDEVLRRCEMYQERLRKHLSTCLRANASQAGPLDPIRSGSQFVRPRDEADDELHGDDEKEMDVPNRDHQDMESASPECWMDLVAHLFEESKRTCALVSEIADCVYALSVRLGGHIPRG